MTKDDDTPFYADISHRIEVEQTLFMGGGRGSYHVTIENSFDEQSAGSDPGDVLERVRTTGMVDGQNDDTVFHLGYEAVDPFLELLSRTVEMARAKGVIPATAKREIA